MDPRPLARALAAARIGIGAALFAAPRTASRLWLGQEAPAAASLLTRGLGARDLVIGVGQLVAIDGGEDAGPWMDAGIAADAADAVAVLLSRRHLAPRTVIVTSVVATGAAAAGAWLKRTLTTGVWDGVTARA